MPDTPIRSFSDIPGWFRWLDKTMFDALLAAQSEQPAGDIIELGTYLGKSTVVLGDHLRDGERLVALDLFGTDPADYEPARPGHAANKRENKSSYSALGRAEFEANYLALHPALPEIVTGPTSCILDHAAPGSARFVHVDAGHLYENVREDTLNTKKLLRPGGIAVFDDWRAEHTPGVTAAVWEAIVTDGLIPFALNTHKLYGTYDDGAPYAAALRALFDADARYWYEEQKIMGHPVLRAKPVHKATAPAASPATLNKADLDALADAVAEKVSGRVAASSAAAAKQAATQAARQAQARRSLRARVRRRLPDAVVRRLSNRSVAGR